MARDRPKSCRYCGRHELEVGRISWRGACATCSAERLLVARYEIKSHSGPTFTRWRRNMAASVGGVLIDDVLEGE